MIHCQSIICEWMKKALEKLSRSTHSIEFHRKSYNLINLQRSWIYDHISNFFKCLLKENNHNKKCQLLITFHHFILRALDEFFVGVSEKVDSARVPSTDTFPARIFNDWISKHIAFESILIPFLGLLRTWRMEDRTLIGILLPCLCLTLWFAFRGLDGSNVCGLRAENVRILVWSSSDFRSQWVVFENALTLFDLSWSTLVVWFEMEHVASICVGVALFRLSSVVNYVLVWVADQVSAVFSLFEVSCFCHWVIFSCSVHWVRVPKVWAPVYIL